MCKKIEYSCIPGTFAVANEKILSECSELYSNHYGIWGEKGIHPGKAVRLSSEKLCIWLDSENVTLYYATCEEKIVGYAIAFSKNEIGYGIVTWVTQLVVHKDYRQQGIAKNILFSIWGFSNHFAWGIVSANPYAIRALEKATRRRAVPMRIKKNATKLRNIGRKHVPFIDEETEFDITEEKSQVDTKFFVDHGDTVQKIINVTSEDIPWMLGNIRDGWEWFAFTFNDQEPISLSKEEIENMIATSDSVVQNAYSRMKLDSSRQTWMKNTVSEVDYIDQKVNLSSVELVYDLGCGVGRHAIEIARRGIEVIGIDYVEENISTANRVIKEEGLQNIKIQIGDCRYYTNQRKASLVICLYDVIGTFATNDDNKKIISTAYDLLNDDGYAIFSVMNYETTIANAKNVFSFAAEPDKLLSLSGSDIMEKTGNIFDSKYYLVDRETHVIYRKEQFISSHGLPVELIVKDKRFTRKEIISMCEEVGFSILEIKCTNASGWDMEYEADNKRAKEILLTCKKGDTRE